jgi:hypothetical protein
MNLVNCTPHALNIIRADASVCTLEKSEFLARVKVTREIVRIEDGIEISKSVFGEVEGLPEPVQGTLFVVSLVVLERSTRTDLLSPGELVRGADGQPVGCKGLNSNKFS